MAKQRSLTSQEDVAASRKAAEQREGRHYLKIPDGRTPWYILSADFVDGFSHFVDMPSGMTRVVTCAGDPETDHGFAPDDCGICELMLSKYQKAKKLGDEKGKALKDEGNSLRASYQAKFVAIRGERILERSSSGKKRWSYSFEVPSGDSDEESTVEVGVLSLSQAQYKGLTDMIHDEEMPWIKDGSDLTNRVLWTKKVSKKGRRSNYKEVEWSAEKKESDAPEVEIPDDIDFSTEFEVDTDEINEVIALLTGQKVSDKVADDEEVEVEDEDAEDDEEEFDEDEADEVEVDMADDSEDVDDGYLDDVEDDEEYEEYEEEDEEEEESDDEEDEEDDLDLGLSDEGFEDDIPVIEEEEEDKPTPKKTSTKKSTKSSANKPAAKKSTSKKSTSSKSKSSSSKSKSAGTTRKKSTPKTATRKTSAKKSNTKSSSSKAKSGKAKM